MDTVLIIAGIYFFVFIGFIAKKLFAEIDEKSLVLLSVYFLQPMLSFWGIFGKPIAVTDLLAPAIYMVISVFGAVIGFWFFSLIFSDKKDCAIVTAAGIIGNTGNLGVPLLVGLFGKSAAFYAVLINTANVFILYIVGVFLYSLGGCSIADSLKKIVTIPVIWFSILAIGLNFYGVTLHPSILRTIEMGAYASMSLQLIIFGLFLAGLKDMPIGAKIIISSMLNKFVILPLIAFAVLYYIEIDIFVKSIIFLQVCMPLAVSNVNLASLYDSKPYTVTTIILASSLLFFVLIFFYAKVF